MPPIVLLWGPGAPHTLPTVVASVGENRRGPPAYPSLLHFSTHIFKCGERFQGLLREGLHIETPLPLCKEIKLQEMNRR